MRYPILLLLLLCSGILHAADPIVLIYPDGYFLLQGKQVVPARVIDLTNGNTPLPPTDPDDPKAPVDLTQLSYTWAKEANDTAGAQVLAITYHQVAGILPASDKPVATNIEALKQATDISLNLVGTASRWTNYRKNVADVINQRLPSLTNAQLAEILLQLQKGLEKFAEEANAPSIPHMQVIDAANEVNKILEQQ